MDYFRIKNWERFQHYKKRNPSWIKLYTSLLDSYEFLSLPDSTKWQWIGILMLAAKTGNRMPVDAEWLRMKLGCQETVDLQPFVALDFIEPHASKSASTLLAHDASHREEREEKERSGQKAVHPEAEQARSQVLAMAASLRRR